MSEYLGSGLEDFEEELIHIDFVWADKALGDDSKVGFCIEKAKIYLLELGIFCFSVQHVFFFLLVIAPCFFGGKLLSLYCKPYCRTVK